MLAVADSVAVSLADSLADSVADSVADSLVEWVAPGVAGDDGSDGEFVWDGVDGVDGVDDGVDDGGSVGSGRQEVEQQGHRGVALGQRPLDEPPAVERALIGSHGGLHTAVPDVGDQHRLPDPTAGSPSLEDHRRVRDRVAGHGPQPAADRDLVLRTAPLTGDGDHRAQTLDVVRRHLAGWDPPAAASIENGVPSQPKPIV